MKKHYYPEFGACKLPRKLKKRDRRRVLRNLRRNAREAGIKFDKVFRLRWQFDTGWKVYEKTKRNGR